MHSERWTLNDYKLLGYSERWTLDSCNHPYGTTNVKHCVTIIFSDIVDSLGDYRHCDCDETGSKMTVIICLELVFL